MPWLSPTCGKEKTGEEFPRFPKFSQHLYFSLAFVFATNFTTLHDPSWLIDIFTLACNCPCQTGWCNPLHMRFNCSFDASAKLQPFVLGISHSAFSFQTSRSINISWHGAAYGYEDDEGKWHSGVICFSGCHRSRDRFSCNMISGCIQIGV